MLAIIAAHRRLRDRVADGRQRPWGPAIRIGTGFQYDNDV